MTRTPEQEAAKEYHRRYREANRDKARAYARKYHLENRAKMCERARKWNEENPGRAKAMPSKTPGPRRRYRRSRRDMFNLLKLGRPCYDCGGEFPPECLDWDHLPGTEKRFMASKVDNHSFDSIIDEIAKCQLVCACCHRIRTDRRKEAK